MGKLHDAFLEQIAALTNKDRIIARVIAHALSRHDVNLDEKQLHELEQRISVSDKDADSIGIIIDDIVGENQFGDISINIQDADVEEYLNAHTDPLIKAIPSIVEDLSKSVARDLKKQAPSMLRDRRKQAAEFEKRLYRRWKKALDALGVLIVVATEAGEEFNRELRPQAAQAGDFRFDVLVRLHARACQVAGEVAVMLASGFADGAHARWRTLHEIATVASFIAEHDNDTAERYLLHEHVESYKAALQMQAYHSRLGLSGFSAQEMDHLKDNRDRVVSRYGDSFKEDYGWASQALGKQRPNFSDLEQKVALDHMRPYYKMASHNVHANSKGMNFKLGKLEGNHDVLLAGASNAGLADPGSSAAISLGQISITLLATNPNIDRLVACTVIARFMTDCKSAFMAAHDALLKDELAYRSATSNDANAAAE
jgi:hypothetical protein